MRKNNKKDIVYKFTPEELGLQKITINRHRYIDVTPLWIDSRESQRIQKLIEEKRALMEKEERKGEEKE